MRSAARKMFELKAPHRPRSLVITISSTVFSGRRASSGCSRSLEPPSESARGAATSDSTCAGLTAYGRIARIRCCARFSRAADTIFIARVIFCVFLAPAMRLRMIMRFATESLAAVGARAFGLLVLVGVGDEALAEALQRLVELLPQVVGQLALLYDVRPDVGVLLVDVAVELVLVSAQ